MTVSYTRASGDVMRAQLTRVHCESTRLGGTQDMKAITFEEAKARYVHRYTADHVPEWAKHAAPNGKYYAPQYVSDWEWFCNTQFPPNNPLGPRVTDCYSDGQTWPNGRWLDRPYRGK